MALNQLRSRSHRRRMLGDDLLERMLRVDPVPPILLHPMDEASGGVAFDASPEGNDGVYNGGVRYGQPGIDRRTSVLFAEATTNLVTNPSFETNTTGWITNGANTIERSLDRAVEGSYSLKCIYQDNAWLAYISITLTAVAHSLAMQVYIPSDYDGTALRIVFAGFADENKEASPDMDKRDQWQYVAVVDNTPGAGDLEGLVGIHENGSVPTAGKFIYIDAVQCEANDSATAYCDGSLGPGFTWSGVAHASTSARAGNQSDLISAGLISDFDGSEGSCIQWLYTLNWPDGVVTNYASFATAGGDFITITKQGPNSIRFRGKTDGNFNAYDNATAKSARWYPVGFKWEFTGVNTEWECFIDGVSKATFQTLGEFQGPINSAYVAVAPAYAYVMYTGLWTTVLTAAQFASLAVR